MKRQPRRWWDGCYNSSKHHPPWWTLVLDCWGFKHLWYGSVSLWVFLSFFFWLLPESPIVVMGLLSFQVWKFVQSTWWGWWRSCCDFAGDGFYAQVCDTVSRFWLTPLLQFCGWEISQYLSCDKLHKSLKCLLQVEKLMVIMTAWMLDWVLENQETHHWHGFLSVFLVSEFVSFLLVADVYMSLWMSLFAGDLILELVEMFLKAAMDASSYSQQPSPRSFVYVRTRISTAEHRVSEAAWAVQGILNICLKNKEEIYNQLSPFARCINRFSSQDKQAIGQSIQIWYLC